MPGAGRCAAGQAVFLVGDSACRRRSRLQYSVRGRLVQGIPIFWSNLVVCRWLLIWVPLLTTGYQKRGMPDFRSFCQRDGWAVILGFIGEVIQVEHRKGTDSLTILRGEDSHAGHPFDLAECVVNLAGNDEAHEAVGARQGLSVAGMGEQDRTRRRGGQLGTAGGAVPKPSAADDFDLRPLTRPVQVDEVAQAYAGEGKTGRTCRARWRRCSSGGL